MPKVSVLIPTYNTREEHLRACIESILGQTFSDFELLLLDDASPDPSVRRVIESYSDSRIRFEQNPRNLGISASRNRLIDLSQGEYLAVMDHDDMSRPERLARQVEFLDSHHEVGVVGSWLEKYPKGEIRRYPADNIDIENILMFSVGMFHPSCMIRKSVLEENGLRYEEEFSPSEDYALFARLIGKTRFANIQEALFLYRSHESNTTKLRQAEMHKGGIGVQNFARAAHPDIFMRARESLTRVATWKLFRGIPVMKVKYKGSTRKTYLLFGVIPVLSWKIRHDFFA